MNSVGTLNAAVGSRLVNPFARPVFERAYGNTGLVAPAGAYDHWDESAGGVATLAGGAGTVALWRNGKRAVTFSDTTEEGGFALSASTERTWYFALRIPPNAGAFSGVGPTSTADFANKNFPLYFKASTVIGSQPSSSNRDSSLDMSPYYGLDAVISVRQAAAGIRFSMRIAGVSGRVITTASGEACAATSTGWSAGGWYGGGGEFPYPLAFSGVEPGAPSDAAQDEGVDHIAWENDLITP